MQERAWDEAIRREKEMCSKAAKEAQEAKEAKDAKDVKEPKELQANAGEWSGGQVLLGLHLHLIVEPLEDFPHGRQIPCSYLSDHSGAYEVRGSQKSFAVPGAFHTFMVPYSTSFGCGPMGMRRSR